MQRWRKSRAAPPAPSAPSLSSSPTTTISNEKDLNAQTRPKWNLGILNDKFTDEVPGSILLLSKPADHNEPLGLQNVPTRMSASPFPSPYPHSRPISRASSHPQPKRTEDGAIILDPQPDESPNDPLNWSSKRRDAALLSLGLYCMLGGGTTPILAAAFMDVSEAFHVSEPRVALTTGLYMMGLGVGSVITSPTAILFGKRTVYLVTAVLFILSTVWCALSPSFNSMLIARIVQGMAVSPVECLPSATIAEIFFLHERAYRLGIYTLLLLSGKNLIPLVSAIISESLGWRWIFWMLTIVIGLCLALLFLFVPETFWDRTPRPHHHKTKHDGGSRVSFASHFRRHQSNKSTQGVDGTSDPNAVPGFNLVLPASPGSIAHRRLNKDAHVGFATEEPPKSSGQDDPSPDSTVPPKDEEAAMSSTTHPAPSSSSRPLSPPRPILKIRSPRASGTSMKDTSSPMRSSILQSPVQSDQHSEKPHDPSQAPIGQGLSRYTSFYRSQPPKSFIASLKPYSGRLSQDSWFKVAFRPFILFLYPSILWSTVVYSLSIGWLIVLSESVSLVYRNHESYNFTAIQTGLVYISPFVGGVLGTAVAGKVSDFIVRFMARKNDGIYEPEFRLVMAIPVAITTGIGLMGFGWSAEEKNNWFVPTFFFGVISFGCSLGSTTAITFCVDSYRQYAGEALVTLNFAKNIFHGLVFSLFFANWLEHTGPKSVFLIVGGAQLACLVSTIPMYIYGKRARMWTVRKNFVEHF
ncbi:MFS general substrate transporter [Patellaria atrata CBS 101060]|uniref:MFS general substrate transporter n=1 Tax=Patellaria atrata CBS 101060 TaxID=1346257 RepID=A0A9P4SAK8_9PEZI|nr:MFS general substrate transporter [Patellaria atrata CBS 101060]